MRVVLTALAAAELADAAEWYENRASGLTARFLDLGNGGDGCKLPLGFRLARWQIVRHEL